MSSSSSNGRSNLNLDLKNISEISVNQYSFVFNKFIFRNYFTTLSSKLIFPNKQSYEFTADNLIKYENIGVGSFGGVVTKMQHKLTGTWMAVKVFIIIFLIKLKLYNLFN